MPNITKHALEASLKNLMLKKPLDKITISDLTADCGISRMAFYYHFKDIYDLIEWSCIEDASRALQGKKTYDTWQEGLLQIFEVVLENKPFILNAYRCISRDQIENYLFQLTHSLIMGVVEEKSVNTHISVPEKNFIADFYKYSFVGIMLDWIKNGMKDDYQKIVEYMCITLHGNITNSIHNFTKRDI
ncbi:MAG: TetR/AcrR family transcriptional regulator [Eubacteriales bacterium]|nr:TetR/AcrR family transcriptional regulator [Eubacteriales bacterium]